MDENRVQGGFKEAAGKVEEAVGDFVGDAKTKVSGTARAAAGQAQQAYGQAADEIRDFAASNPLGALLAAAGVGLVVGLILAKR